MWIYLIITVLLLVAELIYFKIADQLKLVVRPEQKNFQQRTTWRGGGVCNFRRTQFGEELRHNHPSWLVFQLRDRYSEVTPA